MLGLLDQGVPEGSDMAQTCVIRGVSVKGGSGEKGKDLGVRWRVVKWSPGYKHPRVELKIHVE